jgi:hypothetical protein
MLIPSENFRKSSCMKQRLQKKMDFYLQIRGLAGEKSMQQPGF